MFPFPLLFIIVLLCGFFDDEAVIVHEHAEGLEKLQPISIRSSFMLLFALVLVLVVLVPQGQILPSGDCCFNDVVSMV